MKLVIFDFDGTLFFETSNINYYAINKALAEFGKPNISFERANRTVGDKVTDMCRSLMGTDDEVLVNQYYQFLMKYVLEAIESMAKMEQGAIAMLSTLKHLGYRLAICSNGEKLYLDALFDKFDIRKYFDYIWTFRPGFTKVDGIGYIKQHFQCTKAVMVGDRNEDVISGRANNCTTVAIKNSFGDSEVDSADFVVNSHKEMLEAILYAVSL